MNMQLDAINGLSGNISSERNAALGVNKKRFFKNNHHHNTQILLFGSELAK
jgi:hypothetical protein